MQKRWYDKHAREREFSVGENVLVSLPSREEGYSSELRGGHV